MGRRITDLQHSWRRLKVKSMAYLRVHAATAHTYANDVVGFCLSTWLNSEESEVLAYFPQFTGPYAAVRDAIEQEGGILSLVVAILMSLIGQYVPDRKDFCLELKKREQDERIPGAIVMLARRAYLELLS